jgi:alkylation response protein AidB-like acyl-CoA dehydrogenase
MIEWNARLTACRDASVAAAADLRRRALAVDADPDLIAPHFDSPTFEMIRTGSTPIRYRQTQLDTGPYRYDNDSCLERVISTLELARGDAAMMLACPGPALAGIVVDVLGSETQKELFYRRIGDGRTWSFFAMSEPGRGNDATAMETRLEADGSGGYRLYGVKRYIGNGARGGIGVVFARTGRSALSIRAVLVEPPATGYKAQRLDMVGLRGAYLSEVHLDGVPVPAGMVLGEHLPVTRRGMWGAIQTFHNMRIQIGAMAVGTGLAMCEYVTEYRRHAPGADLLTARLEAAKELVYDAAAGYDADPDQAYLSSVAKLTGTRLAIEAGRWAAAALGPASLIEHPLLEKWTRDVCAFEFMDGTSNIQRLHVAQGYLKGARGA